MRGWLNRCGRIALLMALMLPGLDQTAEGQAPGHVVFNWTSGTFGFTISYRRDSFVYVSDSTTENGDILNLRSSAGSATIEAMPAGQTIDSCAAVALEKQSFAAEHSSVIEPVQGGSGIIIVEDADGNEVTHRVDCTLSPNETYLIRYTHSARTKQFGRFASAARAIRESYRPGYPADSGLPPEITHPDGLVKPSLHHMEPSIPPPPESNLVNHPTRFLAVQITFDSLLPVDALIDGRRLLIPGIGRAMAYSWISGESELESPEMVIENGESVIGRFVFAIPNRTTKVTLCYKHLTNNDCTLLFDYDFDVPSASASINPAVQPLIDPGR